MSLSKGIQSAAAAALSAAMLIAVAACGTTDSTDTASKSGDSSKDSSSTSIQGFDTSSIQKDDEIAALLPDSVTGDGTLTVGTDTSYAPAEFLAEDGKTPVGFDVDLSKALAAVFGLKEETISSTFDSIIPSVGSKYDLGISSFTVTKERMQAVDFVTYFKTGSTLRGAERQPEQGRLLEPVRREGGRADRHHAGRGSQQGQRAVQGGRQGCHRHPVLQAADRCDHRRGFRQGLHLLRRFHGVPPTPSSRPATRLEVLGEDTGVVPEAVAIKKGDTKTAEAVQKAIQKLMGDDTYKKILDTWGVGSGAIDKAEINPADAA